MKRNYGISNIVYIKKHTKDNYIEGTKVREKEENKLKIKGGKIYVKYYRNKN